MMKRLKQAYKRYLLDHHPERFAQKQWIRWKGVPIDWDNPRDLNEKIQWLMCFSDTTEWTRLSDKLAVRDYIREKGLGNMLTQVLGVWDDAWKIDFDSLPRKFVLKCNHDSGSAVIVDKYSPDFDREKVCGFLERCLKTRYGYRHGEIHYNRIEPRVFAEEFLEQTGPQELSGSMIDYKIWCFGGKPYSIWACYGRTAECTYVNIYDLDWHVHEECSVFTGHYRNGGGRVPRPECLKRMLEAASVLSEGFPEVRVDFYQTAGKLYFGEMTFASLCGRMDFYTQEYLDEMGRQVVLPDKKERR